MVARFDRLRRIHRGSHFPTHSNCFTMTFSKIPFARSLLISLGAFAFSIAAAAQNDTPGAVYTSNNAADPNRVLAFSRSASGELKPAGAYPTGGSGTGAALGSQGALAATDDG